MNDESGMMNPNVVSVLDSIVQNLKRIHHSVFIIHHLFSARCEYTTFAQNRQHFLAKLRRRLDPESV